jgi:GH18 family chitinase
MTTLPYSQIMWLIITLIKIALLDEAGAQVSSLLLRLMQDTHAFICFRNLKVTLSIGGWTYSQDGHFSFVTDANKRTTFVNSALQLVEDYGLDGIDLDFEYPSSPAEGQGFADLITALRTAFDSYASKKGDSVPYTLTVRNNFLDALMHWINHAL